MFYSLKQAADATGKTKPTILRAIKASKISAQKDVHGQWQIDPAELHRVYKPADEPERETVNDNNALEREVALLREVIADLREDRDRWRIQAERLALSKPTSEVVVTPPTSAAIIKPPPVASPAAAEDHPDRQSPPHVSPPPSEASWFRRMMGGK
jgi:hypothetical protein